MKSKSGFTLVEMIVAIGTVSLVLPVIFLMVISLVREQARFLALKLIKSEGENALYTIRNTIKTRTLRTCRKKNNKPDCSESCRTGDDQSDFYFQDFDGNFFRFYIEGDNQRLASEAVYPLQNYKKNTNFISSKRVNFYEAVPNGSLNLIKCTRDGNNTILDVGFKAKLDTKDPSLSPSMIYKTKILLISK